MIYEIFPVRKRTTSVYQKYLTTLKGRHPCLKTFINAIGHIDYEVPIWSSISDAVVYSVIGQMLSIAATKSIIQGLLKKYGSSENILNWAARTYKINGALNGLSQRKRRALFEWKKYVRNKGVKNIKKLSKKPLYEYRKEISSIWGFGEWSADMIGIFHFGRMDIWPEKDIAISRISRMILGVGNQDVKKYIQGCETVMAIYCWEFINKHISWDTLIKEQKSKRPVKK